MCEKNCERHDTDPCEACLPPAEAREAYISGLVEKAGTYLITREEAFLILQGTLSEMLAATFPQMEADHAATVEGTVERENSRLFIEIAKNLKSEMDALVDHAMNRSAVIVNPGFGILRPR